MIIPLTVLEVRSHVQIIQGECNVATDLRRKVGVESKPLQMNTENLNKERREGGRGNNL